MSQESAPSSNIRTADSPQPMPVSVPGLHGEERVDARRLNDPVDIGLRVTAIGVPLSLIFGGLLTRDWDAIRAGAIVLPIVLYDIRR